MRGFFTKYNNKFLKIKIFFIKEKDNSDILKFFNKIKIYIFGIAFEKKKGVFILLQNINKSCLNMCSL